MEKFFHDPQISSILIYPIHKATNESRTRTMHGFHTIAKLSPWWAAENIFFSVEGGPGLFRVSMQAGQAND